jgi:SAM-dependent methyltransferase
VNFTAAAHHKLTVGNTLARGAAMSVTAYWKIEQKIAPGLRYSQVPYKDVLDKLVTSNTRWIDVGCGHAVLPDWMPKRERVLVERAASVIGVDIDAESASKHRSIRDIRIGSIYELPLESDSADLVTANMVVEHLEHPTRAFSEVKRVLRVGGKFLIHTPNLRGYIAGISHLLPPVVRRGLAVVLENRHEEDVYKTYYHCNTQEAILRAAEESGLEVLNIRHVPTNAVCKSLTPVAVIELAWIRATMTHFRRQRTNMIAVLSKPARAQIRVA